MQNNFPAAPELRDINTNEGLSEETPCFSAVLEFDGFTCRVGNDGRGGCNRYSPPLPEALETVLNAWAARTLPPIQIEGCAPLARDFETWTFEQAYDAAN